MLLKRTRWLVGASGLLVAFSAQAQTSQTPQKAANQAGQSAQQAGQAAQQAGQAAQQAGEAAQQAGQATQQTVQQGMQGQPGQQGQQGQGQTSGQTEPGGAEPAMPQTTSPGTSGQPSGQTGQTGMAGEKPDAGTCREADDKVEFGFNSASPEPAARKKLDEVATWLAADPQRSVIVKASTDQKGSAKYNEDLSFRRAQSVATGLIGRGVDPARVVAVGEGEAPAAEGEPPAEQRSATLMLCQAPAMAAAPTPTPEPPPAEPAPEPAPAEPSEPLAQAEPTEPTPTTPYQEPSAVQAAAPERPSGLAGIGVGFDLGGGVIGFTDKQASRLSHVGGSWDVRLSFGTRLPVALEAAYVGSAQNVANLNGISTSAILTGNGAEGALRVQLPTFYVRPYVFGGAGWIHYSLVNTNGNVSLLPNRDDVFTVPLGVGVFARTLFGGTADVRGTIRLAYREQLFNGYYAGSGEHADLHTWGVTARLGWEF